MAKKKYSIALCKSLRDRLRGTHLFFAPLATRHEEGDILRPEVVLIDHDVRGQAVLRIEKFIGGGFAGQVYRCVLEQISWSDGSPHPQLTCGTRYAVKIIVPPSRLAHGFRNFIYWLGFQGPFSAQVNEQACRSGLLLQKIIRHATTICFGRNTAVKDVYAYFHDDALMAYGEITEWVEGRTWLFETDDHIRRRRQWRTIKPEETASAEYVAKHQFMAGMVELLHDMGLAEFARQYEWSTMKSQPNVLKRTDVDEPGPAGGLCAIDFRAGLALLPFLPMSPGDFRLIIEGLFKRRTLVQFDRCDVKKLRAFTARHAAEFKELEPLVKSLVEADGAYRRSLPDLTHQGWALIIDRGLRADVRRGLTYGYLARRLVDPPFADLLACGGWRFPLFYLLGAIPLLGRWCRRVWGQPAYRRHIKAWWSSGDYRRRNIEAYACHHLIAWHRHGRCGHERAERLADRPYRFLLERFTLGLLPFAGLHRILTEPSFALHRVRAFFRFLSDFWKSADFREQWFLEMIEEGARDGMLTEDERRAIESHVRDPFIVKYLKCLAVHFATLPVTQIVSVLVGAITAGWMLARGHTWLEATGMFAVILALFQITPISPGSICRGGYVVYLMIRERNWHDYLIAAPISFVKYLGYLAFPLQMTTTYPHLARFLAGRWSTNAVHFIPVFGEKGALLEHWVFDLFFNIPRALAGRIRPHIRGLLTIWMLLGILLAASLHAGHIISFTDKSTLKATINVLLATTAIFLLPRLVFYPLLKRGKPR